MGGVIGAKAAAHRTPGAACWKESRRCGRTGEPLYRLRESSGLPERGPGGALACRLRGGGEALLLMLLREGERDDWRRLHRQDHV